MTTRSLPLSALQYCAISALALSCLAAEPEPAPSRLQVSELSFSFEIFDPGQPVEHTYYLQNLGADTIQLERIALTPPLHVRKLNSKILPGQVGQLVVCLGTPRDLGQYQGAIEVSFKNKDLPVLPLAFVGKITPVLEIRPLPAFFLATTRGRPHAASLEIINQDPEPVQITAVQYPNTNAQLKLTPVEPGRRYRLDLNVPGDAPAGRQKDRITLLTSSKKQPRLVIEANILVRERVHTFPETIDLGRIQVSQLRANPALTNLVNQTLMVYQEGGTNFQATATTQLDGLNLALKPSSLRDRSAIQVQVAVNRLVPGPFNGVIRITTNDRDFSTLSVPVQGTIE